MFRTFLATAGVALLVGCAANGGSPKRAAALQSTQPVLYLSIRSAEQVRTCIAIALPRMSASASCVLTRPPA